MNDIIKEGAVAVRSHFLWRERFVVIKKGQVLIFRRRDGSVKAKIDLLHSGVKLTFHNENSHITISHGGSGKHCNFDCHTTSARDMWLHHVVYEKVVRIVTQPIFTLLFAKVKFTFANEDAKVLAFVTAQSGSSHDDETHHHERVQHQQLSYRSISSTQHQQLHQHQQQQSHSYTVSPMELAAWIARHAEAESSSSLPAAAGASEPMVQLLMRLCHSDRDLGAHLSSVLYTLQQLLDAALLPRASRDAIAHVQAAT